MAELGNEIIRIVCEETCSDLHEILKDRKILYPPKLMSCALLRYSGHSYKQIKQYLGWNWDCCVTSAFKSHQFMMKDIEYRKLFEKIRATLPAHTNTINDSKSQGQRGNFETGK